MFVEDTVVIFGEPGLEISRIEEPGHLDGGDVLKVGRPAYVGLTSRTDRTGIDQLRALLEPPGWQVVAVPVSTVLTDPLTLDDRVG